jgi:D-3-phosphoglycerate dehydrogenase
MEQIGLLPNTTVTANLHGTRFDDELFKSFLENSNPDILIVGLEPVNSRTLDAAPNLKFVAKYGVGLDNIDKAELEKRSIQLGWTGGLNKRSVSELVLAFALGHLRNVTPSIEKMRTGSWIKSGGRELSQCTFGIIGLGQIGSDLASILNAFGTRVVYCDSVDRSEIGRSLNAKAANYREVLEISDIISFHVPLTPDTQKMFGSNEINICKTSCLVINTSRGAVIDFDVTCRAVRENRLGGFASDVFPIEPFDASLFEPASPFYFTPHIGGNSSEAVTALGLSAIGHVKRYLKC